MGDIFYLKILSILKNQRKGKGGEIHITDAIKTLVKKMKNFTEIFLEENILIVERLMGLLNLELQFQNILKNNYENMYDRNRLCWFS